MNLDVHTGAIIARDTKAFALWLAGAEAPIRESLRSFARVVDVEAVLQEALVRVWRVAPRFVSDGAPNGLLRLGVTIARNLAVSEVRRTKAKSVPFEDIAVEPSLPDPLLREVLVKCIEKLPEQPKRALDARLGGGEDSELAEGLHMKLNTFLQNFGRARKLLAECLEKNGAPIADMKEVLAR